MAEDNASPFAQGTVTIREPTPEDLQLKTTRDRGTILPTGEVEYPFPTYRINNKDYRISEDPQQMQADILAIRQDVDSKGLREIFNPEFTDQVDALSHISRMKVGAQLSAANSPNQQLNIISANFQDGLVGWEFGEDGELIVDIRSRAGLSKNEAGEDVFTTTGILRGVVDRPGASLYNAWSFAPEAALALPFAGLASKVKLATKLGTAVRMGISGASGGLYEAGRQFVVEDFGEDSRVQAEEDQMGMTGIMLAMMAGAGGEALGATVSWLHRLHRNKAMLNEAGTALSERGESAVLRMGLDPDIINHPDVLAQFAKTPGFTNRAFTETFIKERPDLMMRMAIEGVHGTVVKNSGEAMRPALTKLGELRRSLHLDSEQAFSPVGKYSTQFKSSFGDKVTQAAYKSVRNDVANNPAVNSALKSLNNIFDNMDGDAIGVLKAYNKWRAGVVTMTKKGQHAEALEGLVGATDKTIEHFHLEQMDFLYDITNRQAQKQIKNIEGIFKRDQLVQGRIDSIDVLSHIMDQQADPNKAARVLFGLNRNGNSDGAVQAAHVLKNTLGENSPEFLGVKSEFIRMIAAPATKGRPDMPGFNRATFAKEFKGVMDEHGPMMNAVFNTDDLDLLRNLAFDPSNKTIESVIGQLLEIRYGLQATIVTGAVRRFGNIKGKFLDAPPRSFFSKPIVAAALAEQENIGFMAESIKGGINTVWEKIQNEAIEQGWKNPTEGGTSGFEDIQRFSRP
jgi:hypothetical protein